ncbi:MAG: hypothetical protein COA44_03125 [Arcobacter sp.]|nr:MAG: hypothetical protein COA44_03125 [Arcobacter sp.]
MEENILVIEKDSSLDKPGAGIPWHQEKFIQYLIVPILPSILNWERGLSYFQKQVAEIVELVNGLDENTLSKQVLVPPMFALEDSSRFWSINMVLEHLVTVNLGTMEIVDLLSQEKKIERELGTAKVKPFKNTKHTKKLIVFEKAYSRMIKRNSKQVSTMTKDHPWFGSFNNTNWHSFIGIHNRLHKKQIQNILELI